MSNMLQTLRHSSRQDAAPTVRTARQADVGALVAIEDRCFETDRLSRRNFSYLLSKGHCIFLLVEVSGRAVGYAIVLLHGTTSLARLYSMAVDPDYQRRGIGKLLLEEAEQQTRDAGCVTLRLEVRPDNQAAIKAYRAASYRDIGIWPDYYEDHCEALRLEKQLAGGDVPSLKRVPFFAQTLEFTCGPASLMMAMHALDPSVTLDRTLELRLWRESTLIFMMSGHGGCGPQGLALAAWRRGFDAEIFVSDAGVPFIDSVRSAEKQEVMCLVHEDFGRQVKQAGIPVHLGCLSADALSQRLADGEIPIVLISLYRIYGEKTPHWVVLTGIDTHFIYFHDPYVERSAGKTETDCVNVPITRVEFDRVARYGGNRLRATVLLSKRRQPRGKRASI
jgi:ribosomal-protein-alanine acetyltransferase